MINTPKLKSRFLDNEKFTACWLETFSSIVAEVMAHAGYDIAMIDLEHGPGSVLDAISIMQAIQGTDCLPVIRATDSNAATIKRIMDIGPAGIMVPSIRNVKEARDVVKACRYGPAGNRGAAPPILRASGYGKDVEGYLNWLESEFLLIGQVESKTAVEQIDEITAVGGLDMIFIGPTDLSASLGKLGDFSSDDFKDAMRKIEKAVLNAGKLLGCIPFPGYSSKYLYQSGYSFVVAGADNMLLLEAAKNDVQALHDAMAGT